MKKFLAFLLAVIILAAVAVLSLGDNFFMINLALQNKERATTDIKYALAGYQDDQYYDLVLSYSETDLNASYYFKIDQKNSGFTLHYVQTGTVADEMYAYYKDGKLYKYNVTSNTKTYATTDFDSALELCYSNPDLLYLKHISNVAAAVETLNFTDTFAYSFSPFYVGLTYSFANADASAHLIYVLDATRTLRSFSQSEGGATVGLTINSYAQVLTLTYASDLDTYTAA